MYCTCMGTAAFIYSVHLAIIYQLSNQHVHRIIHLCDAELVLLEVWADIANMLVQLLLSVIWTSDDANRLHSCHP